MSPTPSSTAASARWRPSTVASSVAVAGPSGGRSPIVRISAGLSSGGLPKFGRRGTFAPTSSCRCRSAGTNISPSIGTVLPSSSCRIFGCTALCDRVEEEWFRPRPPHELQRSRVENVGDVAAHRRGSIAFGDLGIEILPLPLEAHPGVEARPARVVVAHVPLADERGLVAGALQQQRKGREAMAGGRSIGVVDDAVRAGVLPGQEAGTRRRAQRRGDETVPEQRPFAREPIDIRRLHHRMAGGAKLVPPQVVHEDEDDVGRLGERRRRAGDEGEKDEKPRHRGAHGYAACRYARALSTSVLRVEARCVAHVLHWGQDEPPHHPTRASQRKWSDYAGPRQGAVLHRDPQRRAGWRADASATADVRLDRSRPRELCWRTAHRASKVSQGRRCRDRSGSDTTWLTHVMLAGSSIRLCSSTSSRSTRTVCQPSSPSPRSRWPSSRRDRTPPPIRQSVPGAIVRQAHHRPEQSRGADSPQGRRERGRGTKAEAESRKPIAESLNQACAKAEQGISGV